MAAESNDLKEYATHAQEEYTRKLKAYYHGSTDGDPPMPPGDNKPDPDDPEIQKADALAKLEWDIIFAQRKMAAIQAGEAFEPPLKPNPLKPYPASLIGLDTARSDCRWEMLKIAKEVDAVTNDPQVALDPGRTWQYLNPFFFRQLLPQTSPLPPYSEKYVKDNFINKIDALTSEREMLVRKNQRLEAMAIDLETRNSKQLSAVKDEAVAAVRKIENTLKEQIYDSTNNLTRTWHGSTVLLFDVVSTRAVDIGGGTSHRSSSNSVNTTAS